ncbi:MAG: cyclase family protein [Pseudomonadota bacterium]
MCGACVIEAVKQRMLSRRDVLKAAPLAAAAPAAALSFAHAAEAPRHVVDLTHTVSPEFPTYDGGPAYTVDKRFNFAEHGINAHFVTINEHAGTHLDAPFHFSADGATVDEIPIDKLVCPLAVIDIREKAAADPDASVTPDDIAAWTAAHGPLPDGACVALFSGWADRVESDGFRNADEAGVQHYPGFHAETAAMLLAEGAVAGLASDTLSIDIGASRTFDTHYLWLPAGRWGLEAVAGLDQLPAAGATLIAGAPKRKGGTGGPTRALALV